MAEITQYLRDERGEWYGNYERKAGYNDVHGIPEIPLSYGTHGHWGEELGKPQAVMVMFASQNEPTIGVPGDH
jgi:hypothetical protein